MLKCSFILGSSPTRDTFISKKEMLIFLVRVCKIITQTARTFSKELHVQYLHLISAPVDRTSARAWLYKHPWMTCQDNTLCISMTHIACESKIRSVVRSSMHPCPGNRMAIVRAVVYHVLAAKSFSTRMKCRHCSCLYCMTKIH